MCVGEAKARVELFHVLLATTHTHTHTNANAQTHAHTCLLTADSVVVEALPQ